MGWEHVSTLFNSTLTVSPTAKEQVGNNNIQDKLGDVPGGDERSWSDVVKGDKALKPMTKGKQVTFANIDKE